YQARMNEGDQIAQFEVTTVLNAIELVERRLADLEAAKMVALQNAPQIRLLQKGNNNLIAKINSAFVVTIPVFKTGIIQAVNAKRQKLVADSMAELDRRTNELLLQNAQNIANQSVEITQLAGGTSIKLETLEKTWETIQRGIQETLELEKQNRHDRQASQQRLEQLSAKIHLSLNER
ncbi:MAG: toxic anion resistance protein, partial [Culicoidibacterales bacterium]